MVILTIFLLCLSVSKSVFNAEVTMNIFNEWNSELLMEHNDLRLLTWSQLNKELIKKLNNYIIPWFAECNQTRNFFLNIEWFLLTGNTSDWFSKICLLPVWQHSTLAKVCFFKQQLKKNNNIKKKTYNKITFSDRFTSFLFALDIHTSYKH